MRIAIYGAGSLGTILGAYISKASVDIELINRNKAHIEALQTLGARVTGTVQFTQTVKAYTPSEMSGRYDIVFLMTKQQHNTEVVTMLKDFLAEDGVLVTFQNGLPEVQIADIMGEERVLGCTVAWGATMQEPGVCELTSEPDALSFAPSLPSSASQCAPITNRLLLGLKETTMFSTSSNCCTLKFAPLCDKIAIILPFLSVLPAILLIYSIINSCFIYC